MLTDIIRRDPLKELGALRTNVERLFERVGTDTLLPRRWSPVSDIIENDDEVVITAELPGVKDEDIHITVQNGVLHITGERRLEEEVTEDHSYRIERSYGRFARSFELPLGTSEDDISAGVAYGVLKITIPKPEAPEPKVIAINPGG